MKKEQKISTIYIESEKELKEIICSNLEIINYINTISKLEQGQLKIETTKLSSLIRVLVKSGIQVTIGDSIQEYPVFYEKYLTDNKNENEGYIFSIAEEIEKKHKEMPYILKAKVYCQDNKLIVESTQVIKGILDLDDYLLKRKKGASA